MHITVKPFVPKIMYFIITFYTVCSQVTAQVSSPGSAQTVVAFHLCGCLQKAFKKEVGALVRRRPDVQAPAWLSSNSGTLQRTSC